MRNKRNENIYFILILVALGFFALLFGGRDLMKKEKTKETDEPQREMTVSVTETEGINEQGIHEDMSVYKEDDPESFAYFYVTVRKGDAGSGTDHTFAEVNNAVRFLNNSHVANDVYARAIVQVGDEYGPQPGMLGYGLTETNATIRVRGNSSSVMPRKSYKLKLDDEAGMWRGQSNIALNKSMFDITRFRNKLYFDMLKDVEEVPSIRTQFARLFIKDETAGATEFEDYGLFTQAEVPGKKYLANHGLDRDGYLYKAIGFNFEPNEALRNFDDPEFDLESFEKVVSCKGREDNQKLIDLVEMISDTSIDINEIIGTYIDRDNYITWLAYNILTANIDSTVQNFYLYSPTNSKKWFFIPWDGDNMLPYKEYEMEGSLSEYGAYQRGISNYWGVLLHQRFLKYRENREELEAKMDELHSFINRKTVLERVRGYNETVLPVVTAMPDVYYLGDTLEHRTMIVSGLADEIETAYQDFKKTLEDVMPFFLQAPEENGDEVILEWDEAYDFNNEEIMYEVTVSQYPDMREPLIQQAVNAPYYETTKEVLPAGRYYWTVKAANESGKTAEPMNKIQVSEVWYPGVDILEVK